MANPVFARNEAQLEGAFAADSAVLSLGADVPTTLVQNLNGNFSQNIARLYEVGSNAGGGGRPVTRIYYVGGRAQGQAGMGRVLGPKTLMAAFYRRFGDVCRAAGNHITISFTPQCGDAAAANVAAFTLKFCVLVSVGFAVQATDMIFNENTSLMFSDMHYDEVTIPDVVGNLGL